MEQFLVRYGLAAVFLGAAFEGDVTIVMAGVLARLGFFQVPAAIEVACLGAFVGDSIWYGLGRSRSAAIRETAIYRRAAPLIERLVERVGEWEIVLCRFVYGTRIASMFFWGVRRLPFRRFATLDVVGCLTSVTLLVTIGYGLGHGALAVIGRAKRLEMWLGGAALVSACLVVAARRLLRRVADRP